MTFFVSIHSISVTSGIWGREMQRLKCKTNNFQALRDVIFTAPYEY